MANTANTLPIGTVVKVTKDNETGKYEALTPDGTDVTSQFENYALRNAVNSTGALKHMETTVDGKSQWRKTSLSEFEALQREAMPNVEDSSELDHQEIIKFLKNASAIRPQWYKMSDLKWRFAVRAALRGKNIMVTGPKGCGKTVLAFALEETLTRKLFNIPLGSTQDPRSVIVGNTHFKNGDGGGTFVALSYFAQAIQVPNAIILLDELTRAHPDAWNLLMPVLDYKQRFLRIDESPDTPTIAVAPGVTFIATANIGSQYTATRQLDAAMTDRFTVVEVDMLDRDAELGLLRERFGTQVNDKVLQAIANIAHATRVDVRSSSPTLSDAISTRMTIEAAELCYDGFSLKEASESTFFTMYSDEGGTASERTFIKTLVQKFLPTDKDDTDSPFQVDDTDENGLPWPTN